MIDGRNRYRACQELGIEPPVRYLDDDTDAADFVLSANISRRNLKIGQRPMVAARLPKLKWGTNRFTLETEISVSSVKARAVPVSIPKRSAWPTRSKTTATLPARESPRPPAPARSSPKAGRAIPVLRFFPPGRRQSWTGWPAPCAQGLDLTPTWVRGRLGASTASGLRGSSPATSHVYGLIWTVGSTGSISRADYSPSAGRSRESSFDRHNSNGKLRYSWAVGLGGS